MHTSLIIGSTANIQNASSLREDIIAALNTSEKVTLDIAQLQDVDLSFFQLAYSAQMFASKAGKVLKFSDDRNEHLVTVLRRAGLADLHPTENLNSWLHGGSIQ